MSIDKLKKDVAKETKQDSIITDIGSVSTNVGSDANAASSTGSVHAKIKDAKTAINTVSTNVGSDADSASSTGSIHAKLKDIRNKSKSGMLVSDGTGTNGTKTILNVTGSGYLYLAYVVWATTTTSYYAKLTIKIDGTTIAIPVSYGNSTADLKPSGIFHHSTIHYDAAKYIVDPVHDNGNSYNQNSIDRSKFQKISSTLPNATEQDACFLLMNPIKFEKSLELSIVANPTNTLYNVNYIYELS